MQWTLVRGLTCRSELPYSAKHRSELRIRNSKGISISNQPLQERGERTEHWLRMFAAACPAQADGARGLWKEARELVLIFSSIYRNTKD